MELYSIDFLCLIYFTQHTIPWVHPLCKLCQDVSLFSTMWMDHVLFICSSADRCLGCSHLWALVNSAAVNMDVQTPVQVPAFIPLWVHPERNWVIFQFPKVELCRMIMLFNVWDLPQCLHRLILPSSAQGFMAQRILPLIIPGSHS